MGEERSDELLNVGETFNFCLSLKFRRKSEGRRAFDSRRTDDDDDLDLTNSIIWYLLFPIGCWTEIGREIQSLSNLCQISVQYR